MKYSILIPIIIVAVGGPLTGIFLIPMFDDEIPKETVYTLEIDNKTVYEIVINSTDKSQWDLQNSNVMINGTSYSLKQFTETVREIGESRTEGTELGYQEPLPHDHVLIYEKIEQIIEEQKAQRELLEEIYDLGS